MNRAPISSHHSFDDPRWYSFERRSGLRREDFASDPMEWVTRRSVRWTAIALLLLALAALWFVRADVSDEEVRVTAKVRR